VCVWGGGVFFCSHQPVSHVCACGGRHQAAILPVLARLALHPEGDLAADAHSLGAQWSELEEVAVIEKLAGTADPIEITIPRRRLSAFRESALRRIERETGAQLTFSKDNSDPVHRMLKVVGTEQDIDCARDAVEQALVAANAEADAEAAALAERELARKQMAHAAESNLDRKRSLDGTNGSSDGRVSRGSLSDAPASAAPRSAKRVRNEDGLPEGWRKAHDKTRDK
jgi:Xaa-Pro aminopeptidase